MNPIAFMLATILGYKRRIKIHKKIGNQIKTYTDLGKEKKTKFGRRSLELWSENVNLPYPHPDSVIDDRITLYSPKKDSYAYVKEEFDLAEFEDVIIPTKNDKGEIIEIPVVRSRIRNLDSDIIFWQQNQMMEIANEKYKSDKNSTMEKLFPYLLMGVFLFIIMLCLVIGWMQIVKPALEVAKSFTTANIVCNCTNGFVGMTEALPVPPI